MDFADVLTDQRIPHHASGSKTRRGWINFRCPYCLKDPYMGYNRNGRYVHCWNCGGHPLWDTIHKLTNLPIGQCWDIINQLPTTFLLPELQTKGKLEIPYGVGPLSEFHREYLHDRRLNAARIVRNWGIEGIGQAGGALRWRLYIPIDWYGKTVSWTTRHIRDKLPKYWSATDAQSEVPIDNLLYGIDAVRNSVIVVEGPIDVWAIGYGAVATLGTKTSSAQLAQLSAIPLRVICFDAEPDAQARARKLANDLSVFEGVTHVIQLDTGKDASRAHPSEIESLKREFLLWK